MILRIETEVVDRRREAEMLARRLGLRIAADGADAGADVDVNVIFAMRDDGLELRSAAPKMKPGTGLRIDFTWLARRGRGGRGSAGANLSRNQPLAKAIGRETRTVLDATAGLGKDSALLAAMGFEVTALERHPILANMLDEALAAAMHEPAITALLGARLKFIHRDARRVLPQIGHRFDCVYLDPLFPPKRKASALAKKEIRLIRALVGDDDDAGELLALARKHAPRVVVKRPTHAPPLADDVNVSLGGKLVRYDLYVRGKGA